MVSRLKLAASGPEVSRFAYGAWRLLADPAGHDERRVRSKIDACLELGITTFDHAAVYGGYGCEARFGAVLAESPGLRAHMELVSKCGIEMVGPARPGNHIKHYDYRGDAIVASVERSLRNLHTDRLDVLLLHRPSPLMDADEIAAALTSLRATGKIQHAGVSNFSPAEFDLVASRLDFPLVTNQIEASLLHTAPFVDGTLAHLQTRRISPMIWSPTAGGRLFTDPGEQATRVRHGLRALAASRGTSAEQIAYAWLLAHPSRMQIVLGTNDLARLRDAAASEAVTLDVQAWFTLWAASHGRDVA